MTVQNNYDNSGSHFCANDPTHGKDLGTEKSILRENLIGATAMTFTEHPRLLARIGGAFYLIIIAFALFAYLHVRSHLIVPGNMAQTATNILAHEKLYRLGFSAAVVVVVCNLPLGWILFELLKVVNSRLALLALLFIIVATTIEAINTFNYIEPLFTFSLPEYRSAFPANEIQALARGPIRMFGYLFSVSLTFFSVFCVLIGFLIFRSKFFPAILGLLMIAAGVTYWINSFSLFLALPIPYLPWFTVIVELLLALWLLIFGVNEAKWQARAQSLERSEP
jgi:hypothetical protein